MGVERQELPWTTGCLLTVHRRYLFRSGELLRGGASGKVYSQFLFDCFTHLRLESQLRRSLAEIFVKNN